MPWRKYDEATVAQAKDMRAQGIGFARIAASLGMSCGAVHYHCLADGIVPAGTTALGPVTRTRVVSRGNHTVLKFTAREDARAVAMRIDGASIPAIARALRRKPNSIRSRLQTLARRDELQEAA